MSDAPYTPHVGAAESFVTTSPWAVAAASLASVASVLLAISEIAGGEAANLSISVSGYLLGSLITPILIVVHRGLAQASERELWYSPRPSLDRLATFALIVGLTIGTWHAFVLATEIGKRTAG